MRQYELAIRIAQIHHLVDERKYKKALAVIETLDMRQVRALSDLKVFAEVYTKTEQYEAAKATYLRIYRRSKTRRILYRLIYLSLRTGALEDAEMYYDEFVRTNPNTRDVIILRYRIEKAKGVPIGELITILQELKQEEYIEEWAYELAKLYHRAGRRQECLEECKDILLWFGTGEVVERAKILIDHLEEEDSVPYYDEKDFTVPKKETPNPDDTGSIPDINEFIKQRKAQKKEEKKLMREERKYEKYNDYEDDDVEDEKEEIYDKDLSTQEKSLDDEFIDDYQDDGFDEDDIELSKIAKDGIQKLSGFLKRGKKEDSQDIFAQKPEEASVEKKSLDQEKKEALQEEKITPHVENEKKNKKTEEQKNQEKSRKTAVSSKPEKEIAKSQKEKNDSSQRYVPHSQSGTGITQDLAKEISTIYEMEHREQLKEKAVTVINEVPNIATNVVERMTHAIQKNTKTYIPLDIEEIQSTQEKEDLADTKDFNPSRMQENSKTVATSTENEPVELVQEEKEVEQENITVSAQAEKESAEPVQEEKEVESDIAASAQTENEPRTQDDNNGQQLQNTFYEENPKAFSKEMELEFSKNEAAREMFSYSREEREFLDQEMRQAANEEEQDSALETKDVASAMENYTAPKIPVVENKYSGMPELTYEDLPTTRALQRSFNDILTLIAGELYASHFVLIGEGSDKITGISKRIVRVMKETGYLSKGRIARISSEQLNTMNLPSFKNQLKGNCLLIDGAADLLFPTITKIFSIMDEYQGDFVVILADEGATLDQLFRFVPALAKRFNYIIDITKYTKEDYE